MSNPNAPTSDYRALLILVGATALMAVVHLLPTPAPIERGGELIALTAEGKTCLAILLFAVTLWVGEAMPFAVTSLLVVILIAAFGITDFASAVNAGFGNPLIVFFIGVLFLSTGFTFSGLGTRMVLHVLRWAGTRADRVLLGFLIVGALLSMWITDMAVAAVMLPLGVGVLKDAGLKPLQSNYGRALMISCAYGPLIGGIGTPAGTAANVLALSYLEEISGVSISFGQWMVLGVPAAILMVPVGWWLLLRIFPPEIETLPYGEGEIEAKLEALGPLKPVERKTLVIFALTITAWLVTPSLADLTGGLVDPPVQAVALAGGLTLFLPMIRVMSWKEAQANMDWGGVMLIVAGLSLGLMVFETGAARWLAQLLLGNLILIPPLLRPFVIVLAVAALHLLFSSNTVTGSLIMPILLALAIDLGLDAWTIAAPAAFTSTLAFILVTESPTNVLPYSAGYFSIRDMAKVGIWMTLGAAVCVTVAITVVGLFGGEGAAKATRAAEGIDGVQLAAGDRAPGFFREGEDAIRDIRRRHDPGRSGSSCRHQAKAPGAHAPLMRGASDFRSAAVARRSCRTRSTTSSNLSDCRNASARPESTPFRRRANRHSRRTTAFAHPPPSVTSV